VQSHETLVEVAQAAAREFRNITRFNRVLIYQFDRDWHGEVIAEDGDGELPSYLGLRFPVGRRSAQIGQSKPKPSKRAAASTHVIRQLEGTGALAG
jgi:hypothetical protein